MCPILFHIGPLAIRAYNVALFFAFLAGVIWARKRATRFGVQPNFILDSAFPMIIAGVLGARIVFIAQEWDYFSQHPKELYALQFNGLTSFGGFVFGAAALLLWARLAKQPIRPVMDCYAAPLLLGNAIGRVGCFFNGCCLGVATTSPVGLAFPGYPGHHHPAQLYETALDLIFVAVVLAYERSPRRRGQAAGLAIALLGLGRFVYEFWRAGSVAEVQAGLASSTKIPGLPFTEAHLVAFGIMMVGLALLGMGRKAETYAALAR